MCATSVTLRNAFPWFCIIMWHSRSQTRGSWICDCSHEAMASMSEVSAMEDSDEESAEERWRRLARKRKVRQRAACSTNGIVTDTASDDPLSKQRRRMANSRAAESPARRSTRLQALQLRARQAPRPPPRPLLMLRQYNKPSLHTFLREASEWIYPSRSYTLTTELSTALQRGLSSSDDGGDYRTFPYTIGWCR